MAQAYKELTRGEQTASALEANLTNLESKLDAILAALENTDKPETAGLTEQANVENSPKNGVTDGSATIHDTNQKETNPEKRVEKTT